MKKVIKSYNLGSKFIEIQTRLNNLNIDIDTFNENMEKKKKTLENENNRLTEDIKNSTERVKELDEMEKKYFYEATLLEIELKEFQTTGGSVN